MSEKKPPPNVLEVLPDDIVKEQALTKADVVEALLVGHGERVKAEARVPHTSASSRNRFR